MTRYTATIVHHSIASARTIDAGDTLLAAKRAATREFGDGFPGHTIRVYDRDFYDGYYPVASRRIGDRRWNGG